MLTRALSVTDEAAEGIRYSVFFPYANGEQYVRQAGDNVIGALSHLGLGGRDAFSILGITDRRLPEQGYAQALFEHGFIAAHRLAAAQQVLGEDEPGRMVTVFVPQEMEDFRRIVYNTIVVCSQSVHGSVRVIGQKVPDDAGACLLARAGLLLGEGQYKRLLASLSTSWASALTQQAQQAGALPEGQIEQQVLQQLADRALAEAASALDEAAQVEKESDL